jgi:hypothetical protein
MSSPKKTRQGRARQLKGLLDDINLPNTNYTAQILLILLTIAESQMHGTEKTTCDICD